MFSILILAHLIGDFPLQLNWMIREKKKLSVLVLHASIHFLVMLLLVGENRQSLWPYLLLLSFIHLAQDKLKISLTLRYPKLTIPFFIVDQIFHGLAIYALSIWARAISTEDLFINNPTLVILLIAYLLVTYVLFILEKVFYHKDLGYQKSITETKYSRMVIRAGLVSIYFLLKDSSSLVFSGFILNPYPPSIYRRRAIILDLSVSVLILLFMIFAIGKL